MVTTHRAYNAYWIDEVQGFLLASVLSLYTILIYSIKVSILMSYSRNKVGTEGFQTRYEPTLK